GAGGRFAAWPARGWVPGATASPACGRCCFAMPRATSLVGRRRGRSRGASPRTAYRTLHKKENLNIQIELNKIPCVVFSRTAGPNPKENLMSPQQTATPFPPAGGERVGVTPDRASSVPTGPPSVQTGTNDVAAVLARMREAAGPRPPENGADEVLLQGESRRYGVAGDYRLRFA